MNELRWILIGFGIVLLAGIYLWGRRGSGSVASEDAVVRVRPEPSLHTGEDATVRNLDDTVRSEPLIEEELHARPQGQRIEHTRSDGASAEPADRSRALYEPRRGRVEPTLAEAAPTEELPVRPDSAPAPTLSSSEAPQTRRIERRKILSLRLAATPQRFDGARLLEALEAESLQHGKYDVFHRIHEDGVSIVFSVASMVEPGTFEPEKMSGMQFPGVTLFAQLPGPTPGMHALNELIACARKLQQALGGVLQDDRGVPLTVHRIERLRQEVREFERPHGVGSRATSLS